MRKGRTVFGFYGGLAYPPGASADSGWKVAGSGSAPEAADRRPADMQSGDRALPFLPETRTEFRSGDNPRGYRDCRGRKGECGAIQANDTGMNAWGNFSESSFGSSS
jgi:hypothetical protein